MHRPRKVRMKSPRPGSLANACTDTSTPDRTRNVPSRRQREREDRQQQRPAAEQPTLLGHRERMNQRGADQPRHERRVLHRIPEPPAAPAELVVRPPAAERDADREKEPRERGPWPRPARPARIEAAFEHGGHRKGERHGEADVADVQHRRVHGEREVLQQRIQVAAVRRAPASAARTDSRSAG